MYKTHFYPLRSLVGPSLPIRNITVVMSVVPGLELIQTRRASLLETVNDAVYANFLPDIVSGGATYRPADGMAALPLPPAGDRPFAANDPLFSLFAIPHAPLGQTMPDASDLPNVRHNASVTLLIELETDALVGGICFGGYPYTPSGLSGAPAGTTAANFGLPHELRLTPLPPTTPGAPAGSGRFQRARFIDAEFAYTAQDIVSHSNFHCLAIDPVRTNVLTLTLADFPRIARRIDLDPIGDDAAASAPHVTAFYGYALPYFYVYGYREGTQRAARLRTGVIAVSANVATPPAPTSMAAVFPEYQFTQVDTQRGEGIYTHFSAHSAFGQRRFFNLSYGYPMLGDADVELPGRPESRKGFEECFVSPLLEPNDRVCVYFQQGEEYDRCVAGLKAMFLMAPGEPLSEDLADLVLSRLSSTTTFDYHLTADERTLVEDIIAFYARLPAETDFCEHVAVNVYEIDPPEGASPAAIPLDSKYVTLIHQSRIDGVIDLLFATFLQGLRFTRTSSARYFALELVNTGEAAGQIAIHSLSFIRSAHIAVQPRAARAQHVKALHYRFVGPDLADDYAQLGRDGFNFSIDRISGGQARQVLYGATSLLDLLHTGNARLHQNLRRRAAEFERTETYVDDDGSRHGYDVRTIDGDDLAQPNAERREVDSASQGWREVESGRGVAWPLAKGVPPFETFDNYSGTEVRSRVEHVSSLLDTLVTRLAELTNAVNNRIDGIVSLVVRPDHNLHRTITAADVLFRAEVSPGHFGGVWRPFARSGFGTVFPAIDGIQTVNVPPYYLDLLDAIAAITRVTTDFVGGAIDVQNLSGFTTAAFDNLIAKIAMINGVGVGLNLGASANGGVTIGPVNVDGSISGGYSLSANSNLVTAARSTTTGTQGTISQIGQELAYLLNRTRQGGFDNAITRAEVIESESKRIVSRREVRGRDGERIRGAEVLWQGTIQDIVTGSVPINLVLPATASKSHVRTPDDGLRVRFNSGFSPSVDVDFWFELTEEPIRDDY